MKLRWSPQQEQALKAVRAWLKDPDQQVFRLFGYAGTGKTTLCREIEHMVRGDVHYMAFTGKAALVLRTKGCAGAATIHSSIYSINEDESEEDAPKWIVNENAIVADKRLLIVDEVSMVNEELARDLMSFGVKILVLGDPAQLPPVQGEGWFINAEPDFMLTEVHRQAKDNPIIRMSMTVREGGWLNFGTYGQSKVIARQDVTPSDILGCEQVLVGKNKTRADMNHWLRKKHGFPEDSLPMRGDRLVCTRNDREMRLLNGSMWTVKGSNPADEDLIRLYVQSEDQPKRKPVLVTVPNLYFRGDGTDIPFELRKGRQEFTWGYALTVHKSQGSQWQSVLIRDESRFFGEHRRKHLYTALTRASHRVVVVR